MADLALFGGKKAVAQKYQHSSHPEVSRKLFQKLMDDDYRSKIVAFDSSVVTEFQQKAKEYFGLKYILPTNSGTSALFEMFYAVGLEKGDEVIVPAYTFFATATPLFVLGCIPILADSTENGNIDPKDIEKKITKNTRAIVITHMWGIPCDMDEIMKISRKYDIPVLEDVSHAHGAMYKGKMTGSFGKCSAWSLGARKLITGGQGGMLGTNDADVYQRAILLGHANNKRIKEIVDKKYIPYSTSGVGLNLRMHPFSAAVIADQLDRYKICFKQRNQAADYIITVVNKIPGLSTVYIPEKSSPSWYGLIIKYDPSYFMGTSRERFVDALLAEGANSFDIPHTTSPLTEYQIFNQRGVFFENYSKAKKYYDKGQFHQAEKFHNSIIKMEVWCGKNWQGHAKSHMNALKKVASYCKTSKIK